MLAGTTVSETGAVVELGPFAGLTSKCVALGLKKAGSGSSPGGRKNALYSYDTFEDMNNYKALSSYTPWIKTRYPEFTEDNNDFFPLWKDTVLYEYPTAVGRKGYASAKTLNNDVLGGKDLEVLMIDSAKTGPQLHIQAGGIDVPAGSVLFTMDIENLRCQMLQVYGCLRSGFIVPVYASFGQEHWAWVVTKSFNVNLPWFKKCYHNIRKDISGAHEVFVQQIEKDVTFMASGLTGDEERAKEYLGDVADRTKKFIYEVHFDRNWDKHWAEFDGFAKNNIPDTYEQDDNE